MKHLHLIFVLSITLFYFNSSAQQYQRNYQAEIGGGIPVSRLPFWLHSNTFGKITDDTYLWGTLGVSSPFHKKNTRAFDYALGAEGSGTLGKNDNRIFISQLYGQIRWQNLVLDLGILHPDILYDGLSSTNGNILYSGNTRSIPGINFRTWDFIKLPWIGKWVAFKGEYGEYRMTDDRYAGNNTRLHHKMLQLRFTPYKKINIEIGTEHYAQWGGRTPKDGKLPASFKDYIRVITIKEGANDAPANEINKLGNHIGSHFLKIRYNSNHWLGEFYYNHMFEDGSGEKFRNRPDGLYGLYLTRKNASRWFKSLVYEFYYTKCQSGPYHNDPLTGEVVGGADNYFNNSIYHSGWTFFGQTIGSPFFTPQSPNEQGITMEIYNNRFYAHHLGLCGTLPGELQYKLLMSYSLNYGRPSLPLFDGNGLEKSQPQFSLGLEIVAPAFKLPFQTAINVGFDKGALLKNNFGILLKVFKVGIF